MTRECAFDILAFAEENHEAIAKIARDFRDDGVTEVCVLATISIAAGGKTFSLGAAGAGRVIVKPAAWLLSAARKILEREVRPAGFVSLDEENDLGVALGESLATPEREQNVWQHADVSGMGELCDALDGGTATLAQRLGVTRRRAQQILKRELERAAGERRDLFASGGM